MSLAAQGKLNLNSQDDLGRTPLHLAYLTNRPDVMNWLIAAGADPHIADSSGMSPLAYAVRYGSRDFVGQLEATRCSC